MTREWCPRDTDADDDDVAAVVEEVASDHGTLHLDRRPCPRLKKTENHRAAAVTLA